MPPPIKSKLSVQLTPSTTSRVETGIDPGVRNLPYYHGLMPREEIEPLLKKSGDFLLRKTETENSQRVMSLSIYQDKKVHHLLVRETENKKYAIDNVRTFDSVKDLIDWHKGTSTPVKEPTLLLRRAINRQEWQLNHEQLKLLEKVGSGAFGEVYHGVLIDGINTTEVAIKKHKGNETLNDNKARVEFLSEAHTLRSLNHKNIVRILGVAAQEEPLLIVMEYMSLGSLHKFIRQNSLKVRIVHRAHFTLDAARGMSYLESKKFVHRDVAARNCLLAPDASVKIADFGLSRPEMLVQEIGGKMPVKWLAPECLLYGIYSSKSDVWAFGVLLWELFADCVDPYPGLNNQQTRDKVIKDKYRMQAPQGMPSDARDIMNACWKEKADKRPGFSKIVKVFDKICDGFDISTSGLKQFQ